MNFEEAKQKAINLRQQGKSCKSASAEQRKLKLFPNWTLPKRKNISRALSIYATISLDLT